MATEKTENHESYGMVRIGHVSSNGKQLVGSSIPHNAFISLKILSAERVSDDFGERWFGQERIIEINMSHSQFSTMLCSPNSEGVPCTLVGIQGKRITEPPRDASEVQKLKEGVTSRSEELKKKVAELTAEAGAIMGGKMLKADKDRLKFILLKIGHEIGTDSDFLHEQNQKRLDKMVVHAKSEIEARVNMEANRIGRKVMSGEMKLIEG